MREEVRRYMVERYGGSVISYYEYIRESLYGEGVGYYREERERVGVKEGTDFYTLESMMPGELMEKLVEEAIEGVMGGVDIGELVFVEMGVERGGGLFRDGGRFRGREWIGCGDKGVKLEGKVVLFANELLDAQPFNRYVYRNGEWVERGVEVSKEGELREVIMEGYSEGGEWIMELLPREGVEEGYEVDFPVGAEELMREVVRGEWEGMVLFLDYGMRWERMVSEVPQGTGRGYYRHRMVGDLLERPFEQDITCHVIWDRLEGVLRDGGFREVGVRTQEGFFMRYGGGVIREVVEGRYGERVKGHVMTLLNPGLMGSGFQVLSGVRG